MKSITIKDIAKELGISVSTVSRALQNHPDISEHTKELVRNCAKKLNYKPNIMASNLRTSKNTTIGVILPELNHHFFASVLDGIEQTANSAGYNIIICQTHESIEKEILSVQTLINSRVAGILVGISKETRNLDHFLEVINAGIPLVLYDRPCPSLVCDQVVSDDYTGSFKAVEYLIQTGCRRIMLFSSPMQLEVAHRRYQGWRDALQKYQLPCDESMIITCDSRAQAIIETPKILQSSNLIDAIFCVNDDCAAGVLYAAQILGLKIPNQFAICGFSNAPLCRNTSPMLTTVEQHGIEIGKQATDRLLKRLNGDDRIPQTYMIPTDLIVRETTK
ncbi:MAG: LacI family DNA-binding transcriptional regulator [Paludibacteraceae bacterium]|nr:LacI family DNA-binding transcriptional regulator [Paludibacteraceae bacterium]